jgi:hypothetical protein
METHFLEHCQLQLRSEATVCKVPICCQEGTGVVTGEPRIHAKLKQLPEVCLGNSLHLRVRCPRSAKSRFLQQQFVAPNFVHVQNMTADMYQLMHQKRPRRKRLYGTPRRPEEDFVLALNVQ